MDLWEAAQHCTDGPGFADAGFGMVLQELLLYPWKAIQALFTLLHFHQMAPDWPLAHVMELSSFGMGSQGALLEL